MVSCFGNAFSRRHQEIGRWVSASDCSSHLTYGRSQAPRFSQRRSPSRAFAIDGNLGRFCFFAFGSASGSNRSAKSMTTGARGSSRRGTSAAFGSTEPNNALVLHSEASVHVVTSHSRSVAEQTAIRKTGGGSGFIRRVRPNKVECEAQNKLVGLRGIVRSLFGRCRRYVALHMV